MGFIRRAYRGEEDLPLLTSFLRKMPVLTPHLTDIVWRLSPAEMQTGKDAAFWLSEDESRIVGFADWAYYWSVLDYFIEPELAVSEKQELADAIFSWALDRFRVLDAERGYALPYWAEFYENDQARQAMIEAHGFQMEDDYGHLHLNYDLKRQEVPEPALAAGYSIRPLAGQAEVEAYTAVHRAAFQSTSMTADWRARTLKSPQYNADLDLVAVAPDGSVAGFCVGWLDSAGRPYGQIEPLGVHPDYQRKGLGRALLYELLRRFKAHGVRVAIVEPVDTDLDAVSTYKAIGFYEAGKIIRRGRMVS